MVLTNQHFFYPVLAERIADLSLPEQPLTPIADSRPEVSRNAQSLFNAISQGRDTASFVAGPNKPDEMLRAGFGRALVDAIGTVREASLVRVEPDGRRTYRTRFERKLMDWTFETDGQGRITNLRPAK